MSADDVGIGSDQTGVPMWEFDLDRFPKPDYVGIGSDLSFVVLTSHL